LGMVKIAFSSVFHGANVAKQGLYRLEHELLIASISEVHSVWCETRYTETGVFELFYI
jgi:hypothetical protein